jgi:hypothetical protein
MAPEQHLTQEPRLKEPQPEESVGYMHCRYKGPDFYGEHAHDIAELNYLRDWKRWAEQELRTFTAFARALNRLLNRGDGSY